MPPNCSACSPTRRIDDATRRVLQTDLALLAQRDAMAPDHLLKSAPAALSLAGRRLQVGVEHYRVTAGDAWVLDLDTRVLIVGDFVTLPAPFLDTACAPAWQAAMARIEALPFDQIVSDYGPVTSQADFVRYRKAFDGLLACASSERPEGECAMGWVDELGPLLAPDAKPRAGPMLRYCFGQRPRAAPKQRDRYCAAR